MFSDVSEYVHLIKPMLMRIPVTEVKQQYVFLDTQQIMLSNSIER